MTEIYNFPARQHRLPTRRQKNHGLQILKALAVVAAVGLPVGTFIQQEIYTPEESFLRASRLQLTTEDKNYLSMWKIQADIYGAATGIAATGLVCYLLRPRRRHTSKRSAPMVRS